MAVILSDCSVVAKRTGEMAWQLARVQTVHGCNVMAIALAHRIEEWIGACDHSLTETFH